MKRRLAIEWLWLLVGIAISAAIILPSDRPGQPFVLYGLFYYALIGFVRITIWAVRTALRKPHKPA